MLITMDMSTGQRLDAAAVNEANDAYGPSAAEHQACVWTTATALTEVCAAEFKSDAANPHAQALWRQHYLA